MALVRNEGAAIGILVTLLTLPGCKAPSELRTAYDPAVDFSRFRSFDFVLSAATSPSTAGCVPRQAMRAIAIELQKRGYVRDPFYPDLRVNFACNPDGKEKSDSGDDDYYEYRYYATWPGYEASDEIDAVHYARGTLNVDLIDACGMQLVWEGLAVGEIPSGKSKARDAVPHAIANIFARFPFRAGEADPGRHCVYWRSARSIPPM